VGRPQSKTAWRTGRSHPTRGDGLVVKKEQHDGGRCAQGRCGRRPEPTATGNLGGSAHQAKQIRPVKESTGMDAASRPRVQWQWAGTPATQHRRELFAMRRATQWRWWEKDEAEPMAMGTRLRRISVEPTGGEPRTAAQTTGPEKHRRRGEKGIQGTIFNNHGMAREEKMATN